MIMACTSSIVRFLVVVAMLSVAGFAFANKCPDKWLQFGFQGKCYRAFREEDKNWSEARYFCNVRGGELAIIHTEELNDFILNDVIGRVSESQFYWIGFSDLKVEGQYVWNDDSKLTLNKHIGPVINENDCGFMYSSGHKYAGSWWTYFCANTDSFVCQVDWDKFVPTDV